MAICAAENVVDYGLSFAEIAAIQEVTECTTSAITIACCWIGPMVWHQRPPKMSPTVNVGRS